MKKIQTIPALLLVACLLLLNTSIVSAVPPLPSSFWGTVKINGSNVPLDTVITARINGVVYASKTVEMYQGDTVYSIDVPGDDLSTASETEGGRAGQAVVFYIGSRLATPTGSWQTGTNVRVNITLAPNVAPVVSNIPDQIIQEPAAFTTIALDNYVTDGNDLVSSLAWTYSGNSQLTVNISAGRVATITYPAGWTGSEVITFRATDAGGLFSTDSAMFRRYTTSTISFGAGLNLITLPLRPFTAYDSETLLNAINGATTNCTEIHRWANGGWESFYLEVPFDPFPIEMGQGYLVGCNNALPYTFTQQGMRLTAGVPLALTPGLNLIGAPYPADTYTAETLLNAVNSHGGNCTEIHSWVNGGWKSFYSELPFDPFNIAHNRGYLMGCSAGSTFTP